MIETKLFNAVHVPTHAEKSEIIDFLFENLQEYGDPKQDIRSAMEYATKERLSFGGFIIVATIENKIVGASVVNQTGMNGYIPENILVYIATSKNHRGQGIGKKVMEMVISHAKGDIALHVEKDNPAKGLYEKYGFTNPYLEMRLKREK